MKFCIFFIILLISFIAIPQNITLLKTLEHWEMVTNKSTILEKGFPVDFNYNKITNFTEITYITSNLTLYVFYENSTQVLSNIKVIIVTNFTRKYVIRRTKIYSDGTYESIGEDYCNDANCYVRNNRKDNLSGFYRYEPTLYEPPRTHIEPEVKPKINIKSKN